MIRFSPTKYLYKIQTTYNKHFIRQYICQNKVLIPLKIYSHLHRQTIFDTNRPITHLIIRIRAKPRQRPRPALQIRFYLLSIQKRIFPVHHAILHKQRRRAGHEGCGERGPGHRPVSPSVPRRHQAHSRRTQIRLHLVCQPGKTSSRKIRIRISHTVISPHGYHLSRRGRDCQRGIRC